MSVMVLGTASHAGKSTVVAALCRALFRRGIPVAPFKSQNMSLNSYVTADGAEIGIAQAVQSFAAGLPPRAEMNPILLKPKGEGISQVVLMGRPYRDVPIAEYYRESDRLLEVALDAYRTLEGEFGNVVVEGAGGAAELNLYDRDIANVRLARALRLPILLVGDIERGGIFAQLYGTLQLLPGDLRPRVKGLIVNKFRGDPALFENGITELERICRVPVLGVLPYATIPLPSEDSLSLPDKKPLGGAVQVAILRLPHLSNFTDFEALERRVPVEYVVPGAPLDRFDCIILPGTKNTVDDLEVLRDRGTLDQVRKARERGIPVIGICGGYQMLGKEIIDEGIESGRPGVHPGIGLLDCVTWFRTYGKTTEQVRRTARPVGPILTPMGTVTGYEIHMGTTERGADTEAFDAEGAVSADGLVIGTYLHGLFQNESAIRALVEFLYRRKGLVPPGEQEGAAAVPGSTGDPYEALADLFEAHIDLEKILPFFTVKTGMQ
ncbi:MAG: cobyric acid synthase [Methanomicrobiales archaeon]|nr:adenosylcobyric acid synthase (glutamine-hydrolyzing) [Methanomicrobia archaeon]MDD1638812.1 cobyric acid synthase [Methanomicrobiales archaeon]